MSGTDAVQGSSGTQVETDSGPTAEQEEQLAEVFEAGIFNQMMSDTQVSNTIQSEARSQFQQLIANN